MTGRRWKILWFSQHRKGKISEMINISWKYVWVTRYDNTYFISGLFSRKSCRAPSHWQVDLKLKPDRENHHIPSASKAMQCESNKAVSSSSRRSSSRRKWLQTGALHKGRPWKPLASDCKWCWTVTDHKIQVKLVMKTEKTPLSFSQKRPFD